MGVCQSGNNHDAYSSIFFIISILYPSYAVSLPAEHYGNSWRTGHFRGRSSYIDSSNQDVFQPSDKYIPLRIDEFKPVRYDIFFDVTQGLDVFSGQVNMSLMVLKSTNRLKVHADSLNITQVNVRLEGSRKNTKVKKHWLDKPDIYNIETDTNISANTFISIYFKYTGLYDKTNSSETTGVILNKLRKDPSRYILTTKFEAVAARKAFPCLDEPSMKAKFKLTIRHNESLTAYSNMPLERITNQDNSTVSVFKESPLMATYLVTFAICDFERNIYRTKSGLEIGMISLKEDVEKLKFALRKTAQFVEYFEHYLDTPYSLPKLDIFTVQDYPSAGMEHPGLIIQLNWMTSYQEDEKPERSQRYEVLLLTSHEVSHQWFGNLVTFKRWEDLWLKEGFATLFSYKAVNFVELDMQENQYFLGSAYKQALVPDLKGHYSLVNTTIPEIMNLKNVSQSFDVPMIYYKGACILRMMEGFVGEENMNKAIQRYVKKYASSNAETSDFIEEVQKVYNKINMTQFINSWTKQSGVPIISVTPTAKGRLRLLQTSSLLRNSSCTSLPDQSSLDDLDSMANYSRSPSSPGSSSSSSSLCVHSKKDTLWMIPLKYKTSEGSQGMIWLTEREQEVSFTGNFTWILFNNDNKGYFLVDYTKETWYRLIDDLKYPDKLTTDDYVRLLFDSRHLAESHRIDSKIFGDMLATVNRTRNTDQVESELFSYISSDFQENQASEINST